MVRISSVIVAISPIGIAGHGSMIEPPSRNAMGLTFPVVSCRGGACLWVNQGATIGCKNVSGHPGLSNGGVDCKDHAEPTIKFGDKGLRTFAIGDEYRVYDWTKYHPWRYPGSAPVLDPCGVAGWNLSKSSDLDPIFTQVYPPQGVPSGSRGTDAPYNNKLLAETVWIAGSTAEVAWAIEANHGGGYQYRICPANSPQTEACFQANPLKFVGDKQWLQFGGGTDVNNRTEILATTVTGDKVMPVGSTWRRNPIPACNSPVSGGSQVWRRTNGTAIGVHPWAKWNKDLSKQGRHDMAYLFSAFCEGPTFEPPIPGLYGFGAGSCATQHLDRQCTPEEHLKASFDFGIVDKVEVPDVPAGDYTLSWRWDTEQSNQVWANCADVRIEAHGTATTPFSTSQGCDFCCPELKLPCSNCTKCQNDKSGECAYCWDPLPGLDHGNAPRLTCLGNEAEDGGAPFWKVGMDVKGGWSPGCTKCWADETACKPRLRGVHASEMMV